MDLFKQLDERSFEIASDFPNLASQLEICGISTVDLLTCYLNANKKITQLSRRLNRPIKEVESYMSSLLAKLESSIDISEEDSSSDLDKDSKLISTGLPHLDCCLGGGISKGCVTEVFGASGCGKSHFMMHTALQALKYGRQNDGCIYISTESQLETKRLNSMAGKMGLNTSQLDMIAYMYCQDLESQDHILFTQLPTKLANDNNCTLIIIDSIAHHLRREDAITNTSYLDKKLKEQESQFENDEYYNKAKATHVKLMNTFFKSDEKYANKTLKLQYISLLYRHLSRLSQKFNVAILVANQISDFTTNDDDAFLGDIPDRISMLNNQIGFYSGWDNKSNANFWTKTSRTDAYKKAENETLSSIEASMNGNYHSNMKRQKILSNYSISSEKEGTIDMAYNLSKKEILEEYKTNSHLIRKYVPTLGYHWSKYISTRIMLTKTYKPIIRNKKEIEGMKTSNLGDETTDDHKKEDNSISESRKRSFVELGAVMSSHNLIKGWKVERFVKLISSPNDIVGTNNTSRIAFSITEEGIKPP